MQIKQDRWYEVMRCLKLVISFPAIKFNLKIYEKLRIFTSTRMLVLG